MFILGISEINLLPISSICIKVLVIDEYRKYKLYNLAAASAGSYIMLILLALVNVIWCLIKAKVLYMSFDKFILAVESRDLSQADKSIIRVYSFPKLSDG